MKSGINFKEIGMEVIEYKERERAMEGENRLYRQQFLQGIKPDTIEELWRGGQVKEFAKGCVIMRAKENIDYVCIQLSGKSIIYNMTYHGNRKIIFILGKGALLNEDVLNGHRTSLYCETIEKSQIFIVPAAVFLRLMEKDFCLVRAVMEVQSRKIWRLSHQLKNTMGSIYLERKLAAKLWKLARDFGILTQEGIEIDINLPITFLADMLGAPRETTSRVCRTLVEYGLMKINKKRIIIVNTEKMSEFYKTGKIT